MNEGMVSYQQASTRSGHVLLKIFAAVLILLITLGVYFYISNSGRLPVQIVVAPSSAELTLDGKAIKGGEHLLHPGEYEVKASLEGFGSFEKTIIVDDKKVVVPIALVPQTSEAELMAVENSEDYSLVEGLAGQQAQEEGELFRQKHPIVRHLPYDSLLFRIDYKLSGNSEDEIILQITADNDLNKDLAINQIRNWGFDPDGFSIEFLE